jgi:hypothetical protein
MKPVLLINGLLIEVDYDSRTVAFFRAGKREGQRHAATAPRRLALTALGMLDVVHSGLLHLEDNRHYFSWGTKP